MSGELILHGGQVMSTRNCEGGRPQEDGTAELSKLHVGYTTHTEGKGSSQQNFILLVALNREVHPLRGTMSGLGV